MWCLNPCRVIVNLCNLENEREKNHRKNSNFKLSKCCQPNPYHKALSKFHRRSKKSERLQQIHYLIDRQEKLSDNGDTFKFTFPLLSRLFRLVSLHFEFLAFESPFLGGTHDIFKLALQFLSFSFVQRFSVQRNIGVWIRLAFALHISLRLF